MSAGGSQAAGRFGWNEVGETLGVTDPDGPPPPTCMACVFAELWDDGGGHGVPAKMIAIGIDGPDELIAGLRAEPDCPARVEVQWTIEAFQPGNGGLIGCRITAEGARLHRLELIMPAVDSVIEMCLDADVLIVSTDDDLGADLAFQASTRQLLVVPDDRRFWQDLAGFDFSDPFTNQQQ